jgi:hypothetical protein
MKIEIGESLMLSWLRHAKNCQMVQLNWKPSVNSWDLYNENQLESMMHESGQYFETLYGLDVFKKNLTYTQLIKQGEIDALGIEINQGLVQNLYAVDIAFHELGLNYGKIEETTARILKKMIRTAMIIRGYFNVAEAEIIFASPKVNPSYLESITKCIQDLNHFFLRYDLQYKFVFIANEDFKNKIFNVVIAFSKSIADTSELFMRSIQLYNLFETSESTTSRPSKTSSIQEKRETATKVTNEFQGYEEMKIGALIRCSLEKLIDQDALPPEIISHLLDEKFSKQRFDLNFAFLKRIEEGRGVSEQRNVNGYPRYYSQIYIIHGKKYLLCNDWYDRNRARYLSWLEQFDIE